MRHAVIMAGGSGTRLWPLSRRARPKQLLRLFEGHSLLELARRRLDGLFNPENIWVVTSARHLDLVAAELPDVPRANLIGEPVGRDTANAIGLAANLLALRDPAGTMAVFPADHLISPQECFAAAIHAGLEAAERFSDSLITFGITPDSPHTGYGYIRRGEPVSVQVYRVAEFKEKPTREAAEAYLRSGDFFWNSGMFAWRAGTILAELQRHLPENARVLSELAGSWGLPGGAGELAAKFERLPKISIDYGVLERAGSVLVVQMNCRWIDLGAWSSMAAARSPDASGNVLLAPAALATDGRGNLLVSESDHLIVALGVNDLIVVHSEDATLVCHRDKAEAVRDLTKVRLERFGDRFE